MKKALRGSVIGLVALLLVLAAVYVLLGFYYMEGFPCFTWINGVYCTGKTVYEVNEELVQSSAYDGVAILDKSGARLFVSAEDAEMSLDYTRTVEPSGVYLTALFSRLMSSCMMRRASARTRISSAGASARI